MGKPHPNIDGGLIEGDCGSISGFLGDARRYCVGAEGKLRNIPRSIESELNDMSVYDTESAAPLPYHRKELRF